MNLQHTPVLVVGAGIMGAGIAQVAAQAGHPVQLFDMREGAAAAAKAKLASTLDGLVAKGKLAADAATTTLARITPIAAMAEAAQASAASRPLATRPSRVCVSLALAWAASPSRVSCSMTG